MYNIMFPKSLNAVPKEFVISRFVADTIQEQKLLVVQAPSFLTHNACQTDTMASTVVAIMCPYASCCKSLSPHKNLLSIVIAEGSSRGSPSSLGLMWKDECRVSPLPGFLRFRKVQTKGDRKPVHEVKKEAGKNFQGLNRPLTYKHT